MRRKLKIVERKLGREKAFGEYDHDGIIVIDPRVRARSRLNTLIHELLHHVSDWSESKVRRASYRISRVMWEDGWRRIQK